MRKENQMWLKKFTCGTEVCKSTLQLLEKFVRKKNQTWLKKFTCDIEVCKSTLQLLEKFVRKKNQEDSVTCSWYRQRYTTKPQVG